MPITPRLHNLRHNKSEHSPARWLFWDTETLPEPTDEGERHRLRLWCASLVERRGPARKRPRPTWFQGTRAADLADVFDSACYGDESLWAAAHNVGFDLIVSMLPVRLVERGWEVTGHALTGTSPWVRLRKRSATLTLVDSGSWLPMPEHAIAPLVGMEKPSLPAWSAPDAAWFARCAGDVRVLQAAVLQLLEWWDANALGHWSITGPGSGFNSYKHMGFADPVVVDPEPGRRADERRAVFAGRAEAFRVGRQPAGTYAEVDFAHAFGSVCAHLPLPRRLRSTFASLPVDAAIVDHPRGGILAECEVETAAARYPLRTDDGIVHPVGWFVTTLCGPEIVEAKRRGELRAIGPGHSYLTTPHMARWGAWALSVVDGEDDGHPEVARVAVKAWTRTVPGRWAGRTSRVMLVLDQPVPGWRMEHGTHGDDDAPGCVLDMAGKRYWLAQDVDMDNSFPAILAWIQAHVRVRLCRLLDAIGPEHVIACNTDGLIVDVGAWYRATRRRWVRPVSADDATAALRRFLVRTRDELAPLVPRVKRTATRLHVLGPQHVVIDDDRQLSGVPASALPGPDPWSFDFMDWPGLGTQLEGGADGYRRRRRHVDLADVPVARWRFADGTTAPVEAAGRLGCPTTLLPWPPGRQGPQGGALTASQHPALTGLPRRAIE